MSSKPLIALARWADLPGSFVTDTPSGLRDTGFVDATPAEADIVNAELKQLYLWALYLSDGALSGNHSIAGALEVAGALTCDAGAVVAGAIVIGGQPLAFADFTYTADSTTDQLTRVAHGLETGDGPERTSNVGGTLPGGLTAGTDYYWIKVDADHGRLATSRANALAGVFIDIASNGTGTQTLLHQAGTTRAADVTVTRNLAVGGSVAAGGALAVAGGASVGGALTVGGLPLVVPQLTFTANASTSILATAAPHGLQTGDGVLQTGNTGGAPPTGLPLGLYFAIVLSPTTFQLATSFANAIAGVFVVITTAGTGTQTIAGTGATTRAADATVTRGLTVGGAITAAQYKHGVQTLPVPVTGPLFGAVGPVLAPAFATVSGVGSGGNSAIIQFALPVGKRILAVRATVQDSAVGPTKVQMGLAAVGASVPANSATSTGSGAVQPISITGLGVIAAAGAYYYVVFSNGGGGSPGTATCTIQRLDVDYDQP
jgi:hypothetical protein